MDYISTDGTPTNSADSEMSSYCELEKRFDLRSVLVDIIQTNGEKLVDYYRTNRETILKKSLKYVVQDVFLVVILTPLYYLITNS